MSTKFNDGNKTHKVNNDMGTPDFQQPEKEEIPEARNFEHESPYLHRSPFSHDSVELVTLFRPHIERILSSTKTIRFNKEQYTFRILPISRNVLYIHSDIVVFMFSEEGVVRPKNFIVTLILQSGKSLGRVVCHKDGHKMEYPLVPDDVYNGRFKSILNKELASSGLVNEKDDLIHLGSVTVPKSNRYTEEDVNGILQFGANTLYHATVQELFPNKDLWVPSLISKGAFKAEAETDPKNPMRPLDVVVTPTQNVETLVGDVGQKVSPDLLIEGKLKSWAINNKVNGLYGDHVAGVETEIDAGVSITHANLNIVSMDDDIDYNDHRAYNGTFVRKYIPSITVTSTDSLVSRIDNPAIEMLGLVGAYLTTLERDLLVRALNPQYSEPHLRSIPALGYDQEEQAKRNLKEAGTPDKWLNVVDVLFHRDTYPVMFLQASEKSVETKLSKMILTACGDPSDAQRMAKESIDDMLNSMTNNQYSILMKELFPKIESPIEFGSLLSYETFSGTWLDETKTPRDLSKIGYFEILTRFGETNPNLVEMYLDYLSGYYSDEKEARCIIEKILNEYTGGNHTILHRNRMIHLNTDWMKVIYHALLKSGTKLSFAGNLQGDHGTRQRSGYINTSFIKRKTQRYR